MLRAGSYSNNPCDIDNPLHGPTGAAHVFAPQKGADMEMTASLGEQLKALDRSIQTQLGRSVAGIPGRAPLAGLASAW